MKICIVIGYTGDPKTIKTKDVNLKIGDLGELKLESYRPFSTHGSSFYSADIGKGRRLIPFMKCNVIIREYVKRRRKNKKPKNKRRGK